MIHCGRYQAADLEETATCIELAPLSDVQPNEARCDGLNELALIREFCARPSDDSKTASASNSLRRALDLTAVQRHHRVLCTERNNLLDEAVEASPQTSV